MRKLKRERLLDWLGPTIFLLMFVGLSWGSLVDKDQPVVSTRGIEGTKQPAASEQSK